MEFTYCNSPVSAYVLNFASYDFLFLKGKVQEMHLRRCLFIIICTHYRINLHLLLFCCVARAREDTEKIDRDVKEKASRLSRIATVCIIYIFKFSCWRWRVHTGGEIIFYFVIYALQILKDEAQSKLKNAADEHWSDGALEVNLLI